MNITTLKEFDRQIREAKACANSPYVNLGQKVESLKRASELEKQRMEFRRQQILNDFEKNCPLRVK